MWYHQPSHLLYSFARASPHPSPTATGHASINDSRERMRRLDFYLEPSNDLVIELKSNRIENEPATENKPPFISSAEADFCAQFIDRMIFNTKRGSDAIEHAVVEFIRRFPSKFQATDILRFCLQKANGNGR